MDVGAAVVEHAHAKLNLFLEVLGRRDDGYHELETVMHEIDLADRLTVAPADRGATLTCDDASLSCDDDNLVLRAVHALENRLHRELPCRIHLEKRVPMGAGLGGGSSDAAATLRALKRLHELELADEELEDVAATFGSDTAFFVRGGTQLCRGRGEILTPLPHREDLRFVLVLPALHMATATVFAALRLTVEKRDGYAFKRSFARGAAPAELRRHAFNRLEEPARATEHVIDALLRRLARENARLSGSGSTVYALCDDDAHAHALAERIARDGGPATLVARSAPRRRDA